MSRIYLSLVTPLQPTARTAFANATAFNNWFTSNCYIDSANLIIPAATDVIVGGITKGTTQSYTIQSFTPVYVTMTDAVGNSLLVPSKDDYDNLLAQFQRCSATLTNLLNLLNVNGVISLSGIVP